MYFSSEFTDFFKGLAANNHRDWFNDNRKIYENQVKKPFQQLVADLIEATNSSLQVKNAVFRINRDIRFSKDKTPYQLHVSAVISDGGRQNMQIPGLYVHLSAVEHHIGGGMYMPDKENLMKIRQAIIARPKKFENLLKDKDFASLYESIEGDKNKILPKEIKHLAEKSPWVFNKQFYFMAEYNDENLPLRKDLLPFIMKHHEGGRRFNDFFKKAIE
jgi:uncharacterized protein (TIGR02453 family)